MTRADARAKCIEAQAKALWRLDCIEGEEQYRRERRAIPEKWADPWNESGCGIRQQRKYIRHASIIFDSLHGVALVVPTDEPTEEMQTAGGIALEKAVVIDPDGVTIFLAKIFRAMSAVGDLTNPPEEKQ